MADNERWLSQGLHIPGQEWRRNRRVLSVGIEADPLHTKCVRYNSSGHQASADNPWSFINGTCRSYSAVKCQASSSQLSHARADVVDPCGRASEARCLPSYWPDDRRDVRDKDEAIALHGGSSEVTCNVV
eukprot:351442-Chlamydomonas_euryale.AAC.4